MERENAWSDFFFQAYNSYIPQSYGAMGVLLQAKSHNLQTFFFMQYKFASRKKCVYNLYFNVPFSLRDAREVVVIERGIAWWQY